VNLIADEGVDGPPDETRSDEDRSDRKRGLGERERGDAVIACRPPLVGVPLTRRRSVDLERLGILVAAWRTYERGRRSARSG